MVGVIRIFFAVVLSLFLFMTMSNANIPSNASSSSAITNSPICSNPSGKIIITTISQIDSRAFCSANVEKGQHDIFGNVINTKTLGLNGVMVEVLGVNVKTVSGPNRDCDFDVIITGAGAHLKTEDPIFPQSSKCPSSRTSPPYLVPLPSKGQMINLVGTAFFDANHWEIHPIFAWDKASQGTVTSVCARKGTVSNTSQVCYSGTTTF